MTLLEQLQRIKSIGTNNHNGGICLQLGHRSMVESGTLHHLMSLWPKYSGVYSYPIPSTKKGLTHSGCYKYHSRKCSHWTGKNAYSKLRYELLDFLIAELSKDATC